MARVPLDRLVALQQRRSNDIAAIGARMRERDPETLSRIIIQARLRTVNDRWAEILRSHDDIELRADAARHAYMLENRFEAMNRLYEDTSDWLLTTLENFPENVERNARRRPRDDDDPDDRPAKLPRLDLPSFSGNYEDWDSFADIFTTLVHDAPRLADTTKLQYLKSCLTGRAAELVKDVAILGVNYASTWTALRDRFHNLRLTVDKLLESLFDLPHLKKESAADLRSFVDETQRIVRALINLRLPASKCSLSNSVLVHTLEVRLDAESRRIWESELIAKERQMADAQTADGDNELSRLPNFADLVAFLERRAQSLSVVHGNKENKKAPPANPTPNTRRVHHTQSKQPSRSAPPARASKCCLCSGDHPLSRCATFIAKSVHARGNDVRHLRLCYNCLGPHKFKDCRSTYTCKTCHGKHHTLLHRSRKPDAPATDSKENVSNTSAPPAPPAQVHAHAVQMNPGVGLSVNACNALAATSNCSILLATAQVSVAAQNGQLTRARALLDQGSEATFISESLVQLLGLHRDRVQTNITGVGGCKAGVARYATRFTLRSRLASHFKLEVNAFILPRLTADLPACNLHDLDLGQFKHLTLADPEFNLSDRVDIMIGADFFGQLLRSGLKTFPPTLLVAQNTALGWVVSGPTQARASRRAVRSNHTSAKVLRCVVNDDLSELLQRFWTVEEVPTAERTLKPEDEACEKLFVETHTRGADGRYRVRLPVTSEPPNAASETLRMALGSLRHQHQRFARDPKVARSYIDFMDDYLKLGHMERVPDSELNNSRVWYLPHHAVIRAAGNTLKTRVVFDASRKTRDGHCLNDYLMTGAPLQSDLPLILLNWRQYRYVFTGDIVKMFRQIRLAREDQDLHRVVWSASPTARPEHYHMTTVTYGTACAPFLAIRTLSQLAHDEGARFPLGAACLRHNTYVDDTFAGADDLATAVRKRDELVGILASAGIELDKWAVNHTDLLPSHLQSSKRETIKEIETDESVKTLGVHWNQASDEFKFRTANLENDVTNLTKRSIYSDISRLFDPLGWLVPVTLPAKVLMQDLWIQKFEWDESLPSEFRERWQHYCQSLSALPNLAIPRWVGLSPTKSFEIHGFADASGRAYGAAVYIRVDEGNGNFRAELLSAKTKVSPVKTVSIPNLELCGATLLVKLVCHLLKLDFLKGAPIRLWSDSQIVLMWLKKHPCHWKTFVANRVSLIQTELPAATWGHVPTHENPADLASRGATPNELKSRDLWWHGPSWLLSHTPQPKSKGVTQASKSANPVQAHHVPMPANEPDILSRYSTLTRLVRVTAWCLRPFLQRIRKRAGHGSYPSFLTTADLDNARLALVKLAQGHAFATELATIRSGQSLPKRNPLCKLKPFVDRDGVLRVDGRLGNASMPHHVQHPPILPRSSSLSRLFILHAHRRALHGGPTLTLSIVMRFAWIIGMRALTKSVLHKCVLCQRHKPRLAHQLMGNLPAERVTPARPFTTTGLDYAGPFQVRTSKGRGQHAYKGYVVLFVCFATKAIHLELVSDLTTATFIAAYRRFVSRRGLCKQLVSDNATNFRGAAAELRAMFNAASRFYQEVAPVLANDGTSWTFIPPTTPHYGGLWEAGVKSTKNLLKKTVGEHTLTFEELSTVLAEIEACLNARPLCPQTSDPDDLRALTPSHFLIGESSGIIPDEETPAVAENRLDRFQLMQRMRDQFWKRWSNEYVLHLQERGKWRAPTNNIKIGQLVLIKDDHYPAAKWSVGRIIELHPGKDNLVRVVTVKTATNTLRRHIACLAPLELEDPEDLAKRGAVIP